MYFDAAVVFVMKFSFLFRLALAILWGRIPICKYAIRTFLIEKHKILAKLLHILPVQAGKAAEGAKYDTFGRPVCINILFMCYVFTLMSDMCVFSFKK